MDQVIAPFILYAALVVGAVGVALALPRRGLNPQIIGASVAGLAIGVIILAMSANAATQGALPNLYFYIFSLVAVGASLRVITHQRPVYAALYFILTILASAGLYLILSAEFMAFALVIVYAGAILITYLFVIMLATQAPTEDEVDQLADYDAESREPIAASIVGFILLAALTTMLMRGSVEVVPRPSAQSDELLALLPGKIETSLREAGLMESGESIALGPDGAPQIDASARQAMITADGHVSWPVALPEDLHLDNVEGLGFNLFNDHPGAIEIAGVILLMAMLGAVVLARKQVQIDEDAKLEQAMGGGR